MPLLAEALPILVVPIAAALCLWDFAHFILPVVVLLAPVYLLAGLGWFVCGRPVISGIVFVAHGVVAVVTLGSGAVLLNGTGELSGPGPNAPWAAFWACLAASLLVSLGSMLALAIYVRPANGEARGSDERPARV